MVVSCWIVAFCTVINLDTNGICNIWPFALIIATCLWHLVYCVRYGSIGSVSGQYGQVLVTIYHSN